jgi:thioredoxin reductase
MDHYAHLPVVVAGAGPYGLAVAAHLRARHVPVRVFGDPMSSWRHQMPPGMFLKSTPRASSISAPVPGYTLADYCAARGIGPLGRDEPVPIDLFIDYGRWFQQELVPDIENAKICELGRHDGGIQLTLDTGEPVRAGIVIVATGLARFAYVPPSLAVLAPDGMSPDAAVSHSSQYGDLRALAGSEVIVVGAGQSALESAVLLHEAGARVHLLARRQMLFAEAPPPAGAGRLSTLLRPDSPLGPGWRHLAVSAMPGPFRRLPAGARLGLVRRILGPSGAWWLRERFRDDITVHSGRRIVAATVEGHRVRLRVADRAGDTTVLSADHVLAATGYRVDLDRLDFIDTRTRAALRRVGGSPALGPSFESSVPGLYFPGLSAAATFGPVQRFVCGTTFAATRITAAVSAHARNLALH